MMEKLSQLKNKLFNFMPKQQSMVASMAFYQSPAMSPRGCKSQSHKISIIPKEARTNYRSASFGAHEPTSPKVSCVGQVHSKKKKKRKAQKQKRAQQAQTKKGDYDDGSVPCDEKKGKVMLWTSKGQRKTEKGFVSEEEEEAKGAPPPETAAQVLAPSLGGMKKFTSGRGSLYDFDVTLER